MKTIKLFLFSLVLIMWFQTTTVGQIANQTIEDNYLKQIETFMNSEQAKDLLPQSLKNTRTSIINVQHFLLGGGIVQTLMEKWNNNQWENEMRINYSFDYNERMAGYIMENWDENTWINFQKNDITYNDDAELILTVLHNWDPNNEMWIRYHLDTLMYDDNHNIIEDLSKEWADTGWVNLNRTMMNYDDNNNNTELLMQMWSDSGWTNINWQINTYNEKNLRTEWLLKMWMEGEWLDQMKSTFDYNSDDLLIEEITKFNLYIDWKTSEVRKYEYNNAKQEIVRYIKQLDMMTGDTTSINKVSSSYSGDLLTEELTQIWQSTEWINTTLETYTYEDDQMTVTLLQEWKNNAWENKERWINTYGTVDVEENRTMVNVFSLEQNYPNPFNPSTTISFAVDKREYVELTVYNSLGQLVTKLIGEEKPAGNYQVTFNAVNLPSGVYYYQLSAGNKAMTKKCILLK